jgi:branched-chain amino acid transport system substrate-binding protein
VSFVGTQALADELGKDARGVMVSQVMPYPYTQSIPIVREYLDAVRRAGGGLRPNYSGIEGYIGAKVVIEGLRRARSITPDGLVGGLETLQNQSIGGFAVNFSATNHVASRFVELSMLTEDGGVRR